GFQRGNCSTSARLAASGVWVSEVLAGRALLCIWLAPYFRLTKLRAGSTFRPNNPGKSGVCLIARISSTALYRTHTSPIGSYKLNQESVIGRITWKPPLAFLAR